MSQYIITEKLADEVSEILLRADRQPNKHALVKLLHSHPYQSERDLSDVDIGAMVKEINRRGMDCRIRDRRKQAGES
jgi:hypothetical protein